MVGLNRKKTKVNALLSISIVVAALIIVNVLNQSFFKRFDLTADKRHSLRQESIDIVQELEDPVFIKVYLEGEFPADFKQLRDAFKQTLDELRAYGGDNIQYEFINPSEDADPVKRKEMYTKLTEAGLTYTNLTYRTKDGIEEKIIFPGALVTYGNKELPLQILKSSDRIPSPQLIQNSINNLEYNLLNTITQVTTPNKKRIAWITGHGEWGGIDSYDIVEALAERFVIYDVEINEKLDALLGFDLVVVAGPKTPYSEKDKFILDQYLMKGGSALFLLDGISMNMDSLQDKTNTVGLAANHNLWDMTFNYGVRLNRDVLLDATCAAIPINVGKFGDQPNLKMFPWYFHPTLLSNGKHPITSNVNPVLAQFVSSLDTLENSEIRKQVLLSTSELTLKRMTPARVNLNLVSIDPGFNENSIGNTPVGVLLEGKFKSLYANRIPPNIANNDAINFKDQALIDTRIAVYSDGEIVRNYSSKDRDMVFPLGYDKFVQKNIYGNKDLIINTVDFLLNDERLIKIRSKDIIIRKLNDRKVLNNEGDIQVANLALPVLIVGLFISLILIAKRRKFS